MSCPVSKIGLGLNRLCCVAIFAALPLLVYTQTITRTIPVGMQPYSVAVNPVTNKVYVTNISGNSVTIIDGATNNAITVGTGTNPLWAAVNPVTNKTYIANSGSNNVTEIDGVSNSTTTIPAGTNPVGVAVNPLTNKIYVANEFSNNVTVIDGVTKNTATIHAGTNPGAVAVNPVTNKIYVSNFGSNTVTVIDEASNAAINLNVSAAPQSVAVNVVTNKIYVSTGNNFPTPGTVIVIDGATNSMIPVTVGSVPLSAAVNPVTNKIYVANTYSNTITVIDGATNATTSFSVGSSPVSVVVNPTTNKIFVANSKSATVTVIDGATTATTSLDVGTSPRSLTVNPVTNKIYTANEESNSVTVIDGATNSNSPVPAGLDPGFIDLNPVTNRIYVSNVEGSTVTVIDGATNNTATVPVGLYPGVLAVNPTTNKIYVALPGSYPSYGNTVAVIDGATDLVTANVTTGYDPTSIAINPVTNKIYVANQISNTVTVIDGVTNNSATIPAGSYPRSIAVNPVTNKIYVANTSSGTVTVIDGATNTYLTISANRGPFSVAVNTITNKIYVTNSIGNITLIDGATNATTSWNLVPGPQVLLVAVNPVTNKIYVLAEEGPDYETPGSLVSIDGVTNATTYIAQGLESPSGLAVNQTTNKIYFPVYIDGYYLAAVDGATNTITNIPTVPGGQYVAVNPVTNSIYVANSGSNNVSVIEEQQVQPVAVTTSIHPLTNNQTNNSDQIFTLSAQSAMGTTPSNVFFQVDTWQNGWNTAAGTNPFAAEAASLQPGFHILYAYAGDGQEATSTQLGSPLTGAIQAYGFLVTPAPASAKYRGLDGTTQGTWNGFYGMNGELIANDSDNLPAFASVSTTGNSVYSWAALTSDMRALQTSAGASTRIASTYYSFSTFTIDVNLTDGNTHQVGLYLLDWDSTSRVETISILDATSHAVLDTESFSGFHNGQYALWDMQGDVLIQVTHTGGSNAVVSGIFFDPVIVAAASYSGLDTATQGAWTGHYGSNGELIANGIVNAPAFASVSLSGSNPPYTWSASTSDVRALQIASGASSRIASTYYSYGSFTINLSLNDGNTHKISLYLLDWDTTSRAETITVLDADSGAVLNTETFSGFHNGDYAQWEVQGHVQFQVTKAAGANAVVSAIFFD